MKQLFFILTLLFVGVQCKPVQESETKEVVAIDKSAIEQEIKKLSSDKWQWMADKNVDELAKLFDDRSKFVHMSGSWRKTEELDIIKTGKIWYKQADVHDSAVEIFDNTVIAWNRITLIAVVRGNEVSNEFTVTEVYQNNEGEWKLLDLTFSKVRDTHEIKR